MTDPTNDEYDDHLFVDDGTSAHLCAWGALTADDPPGSPDNTCGDAADSRNHRNDPNVETTPLEIVVTGIDVFGGEQSQTDYTVKVGGTEYRVERWSTHNSGGEDWYDLSDGEPVDTPVDDDFEITEDALVQEFDRRWSEEVHPLIERIQREVFASVTGTEHEFKYSPQANPYCAQCQLPYENAIHVVNPKTLGDSISYAVKNSDSTARLHTGASMLKRLDRLTDPSQAPALRRRILIELLDVPETYLT